MSGKRTNQGEEGGNLGQKSIGLWKRLRICVCVFGALLIMCYPTEANAVQCCTNPVNVDNEFTFTGTAYVENGQPALNDICLFTPTDGTTFKPTRVYMKRYLPVANAGPNNNFKSNLRMRIRYGPAANAQGQKYINKDFQYTSVYEDNSMGIVLSNLDIPYEVDGPLGYYQGGVPPSYKAYDLQMGAWGNYEQRVWVGCK